MKTKIVALAGALFTTAVLAAVTPQKSVVETPHQHDVRMEWWREAKFGMFIHWGVYSVPAGEWNGNTGYAEWIMEDAHIPASRYEQFAKEFDPTNFDAKAFVKTAKDAGMKYIVITSKHHDGFCMWPTKLTDWSICRTPWWQRTHRDPLKELADACRAVGIKFCVYYSIMDWHSSDWGNRRAWNDVATGTPDMDRYVAYMKGQLKELITNYHPAVIWFDGQWESCWDKERGDDLYCYLRSLQPNIIINNRVSKPESNAGGGFAHSDGMGDFGTPEQTIPPRGFGPGVDWESCMTMNDHWGYNKRDNNWKSPETVIHNLCDIASKGGNYLLNVGPTSEGIIPQPCVERLAEVGQWMKVNGQSIYDTSANPLPKVPSWGRITQKPGKLFLHIFDWPKDGKLSVRIGNEIKKAYLLANAGTALKTTSDASGVTIALPATAPDPIDTVVVLEYTGEIQAAPLVQAADGSLTLVAADADIIGSQAKLEGEDPHVAYWTDANDFVQWQAAIKQPGDFDVSVDLACDPGSAGSTYKIAIGDSSVEGTVESTGGWQSFKTVNLGKLHIASSGPATLSVKAVSKPGEAVMNLRRITLTPVE